MLSIPCGGLGGPDWQSFMPKPPPPDHSPAPRYSPLTNDPSTESPTIPDGPQAARDRLSVVFLDAARCCGARLLADMAGIFEPVDGGESLRAEIAATAPEPDSAPPAATLIPVQGTLAAYALATGNAAMSPDLEAEQRFDDRFLRQLGIRSGLILPVWLEGQPVCLLGVFRTTPHDFMLDEVCYLERVGDALAQLAEVAGWHGSADASATTVSREESLRTMEEVQGHLAAGEFNEQQLAAMLDGRSGPECRVSPRHQYPYCQKIAPIYGDQMPDWNDFEEVQCGDLSGGGISIWMAEQPSFRELIVALGRPPAVAHFAARIVYVREVRHGCEVRRAGRWMYQVGCQFLRRVYL